MKNRDGQLSGIPVYHFNLIGLTITDQVRELEHELKKIPHLRNFQIDFAMRTLTVRTHASPGVILQLVDGVGYGAELIDINIKEEPKPAKKPPESLRTKAWVGVGFALLFFAFHMMQVFRWHTLFAMPWLNITLAALSFLLLIYVGGHFFWHGLKSLFRFRLSTALFVSLSVLLTWGYVVYITIFLKRFPLHLSMLFFETPLWIAALFDFVLLLEKQMRAKTDAVLNSFKNLCSNETYVVREGQETLIPMDQVILDDLVCVLPGETIPVDGEIIEGCSEVSESALTHESMSILKQKGDQVLAGTTNQSSNLFIRTQAVDPFTMLSQVIRWLSCARNLKVASVRVFYRAITLINPLIMLGGLGLLWFFYHFNSHVTLSFALTSAASLLVFSCFHVVKSVIVSLPFFGVSRAVEKGLLIRNGDVLRNLSDLTAVVLDKTGVITTGKPEITLIHALKGFSEDQVLQYAASLEAHSSHPIASAILGVAENQQIDLLPVEQVNSRMGEGILGYVNGHEILFGNRKLMQRYDVNIDMFTVVAEEVSRQGETPLMLVADSCVIGMISVNDPLKADSRDMIAALKNKGLKVFMLTGDDEAAALRVAGSVDIDEVISDLSPIDKFNVIKKLKAKGERVGVVADGLRNAVLFSRADVGFATDLKSDTIVHGIDVMLMKNSIQSVVEAIDIAKQTRVKMKNTMLFGVIYTIIMLPIVLGFFYPITQILIPPAVIALIMMMSACVMVWRAFQ